MKGFSRRDLLGHMSSGLSVMAMADLLKAEGLLRAKRSRSTRALRTQHANPTSRLERETWS